VAGSQAISILEPYAARLTRPVAAVAADLESYAQLLLKWQKIQNLVSRETVSELWPRHIADSLQVLAHLRETDRELIDFGSGGGFPALPLAMARRGALHVTMVESNGRKASFLRTVGRELRLGASVRDERGEAIGRENLPVPDVISARALADLGQLCALTAPFFAPKTRALFLKGREHVEEIAQARTQWDFDVLEHASATDATGVVLEISNLRLKNR